MKTYLAALISFALCAPAAFADKTADEHVAAIRQIGQILAEYTKVKGTTPFSENWKDDDPDDGQSPVTIICNLSEKKIPDKLAYPPFSCYLMARRRYPTSWHILPFLAT